MDDRKRFLEALDRYLTARDAWEHARVEAQDPTYARDARLELEQAGIDLWMALSYPFQLMK